jgi:hypothetical protein
VGGSVPLSDMRAAELLEGAEVGWSSAFRTRDFAATHAGSTAWRCVRRGRGDMCGAPGVGRLGGPHGWGTPRPSQCMAC